MISDYPPAKDSLRQECLHLLRNYVPKKKSAILIKPMKPTTAYFDAEKVRIEFEAKNEAYVQELREVMQMGRERAIERNVQATEQL